MKPLEINIKNFKKIDLKEEYKISKQDPIFDKIVSKLKISDDVQYSVLQHCLYGMKYQITTERFIQKGNCLQKFKNRRADFPIETPILGSFDAHG